MTSEATRRSVAGAIELPPGVVALRAYAWSAEGGLRRFAVLADPAEATVATTRVAEAAFLRLCERLAFERRREPEEAMLAAFADAHEVVREANMLEGQVRRADLALVGAVVCIATPERMVVGVMGPGHALVLQDREILVIPPLGQAASDVALEQLVVDAPPLGGPEFRPALFETDIADGDRVLLSSRGLARILGEAAGEHPAMFQAGMARLLRGDDAMFEQRLRETIDGAPDALALLFSPADYVPPSARLPFIVVTPTGASLELGTGSESEPSGDQPDPEWPGDQDLLPPVPRPVEAPEAPVSNPVWATRMPPAPVVGSVNRYRRDSERRPSQKLGWLPRLPFGRIAAAVLIGISIAAIAVVAVDQWTARVERRQAIVQQALASADNVLSQLATGYAPEALQTQITSVEQSLEMARKNGGSEGEIAVREAQLRVAQDLADGIGRLENVSVVGTLPEAVAASPNPRLVRVGSEVYLIADAVYLLGPEEGMLIELLRPGDVVGDVVVEPLLAAAEEGGMLLVSDGKRLYRYVGRATWEVTALGLLEGTRPWVTTLGGGYQGSWYIVVGGNGRVMKFAADDLGGLPSDWTQGTAGADITLPIDMAIDGRIYLLTNDGRLVVYYRGGVETIDAELPQFEAPVAIEAGVSTVYIWVADNTASGPCIVRLDRGSYTRLDYRLDSGAAPASWGRLLDATVLEGEGEVYLLFEHAVIYATLP